MARVLVTDGDQRSSLAVVRSLGRSGHDVVVCSSLSRSLAGGSKWARSEHRVGSPVEDAARYASDVADLVRAEGVDVLLPMTDPSATTLLGLRNELSDLQIPFPSTETYRAVADKRALLATAAELGVATPAQLVVDAVEDAPSVADRAAELGYPVVLKPARSAVLDDNRLRTFTVRLVRSPEELVGALESYPAIAYPILVQERIDGAGLGAFVLAREGEVVATFAHERLREKPPTGGVSVYRRSVPLREDLRLASERLLRHYGWTGVAMVEFKEDTESGTPYLMEINGRFWGSLQLAIDAGVDFPRLLLDPEAASNAVAEYRHGVRTRWLWGDVDHAIAVLRGRSDVRGVLGRTVAAGRALLPWWPGDRFEVLDLGDPRPFLRESAAWFRSLTG